MWQGHFPARTRSRSQAGRLSGWAGGERISGRAQPWVTVAAAALVTGLASAVAPSTVTGVGAGLCLLAFGVATLLAGRHARSDPGRDARRGLRR